MFLIKELRQFFLQTSIVQKNIINFTEDKYKKKIII